MSHLIPPVVVFVVFVVASSIFFRSLPLVTRIQISGFGTVLGFGSYWAELWVRSLL